MNENRVEFRFRAVNEPNNVVTKSDLGGKGRRHLYGISSGLKVDGAGGRMTAKAIENFHKQAKAGEILLYAGKHGVEFTDDIGKLVDSRINDDGDWETGYRLYDESDGFKPESHTLEKASKLWCQIKGIPPYSKPRKKGFSIEGIIPDKGIVTMDSTGRRVMDDIELDGVVVVSRPAYQDSMAKAVYKALGLPLPTDQKNALAVALRKSQDSDDYFSSRYAIDEALEEEIRSVVTKDLPERGEALRTLFAGYSDLMAELVMRFDTVFKDATPERGSIVNRVASVIPEWEIAATMKGVAKDLKEILARL